MRGGKGTLEEAVKPVQTTICPPKERELAPVLKLIPREEEQQPQADQKIVEYLEKSLELAKAGEIQALALVAVKPGHYPSTAMIVSDLELADVLMGLRTLEFDAMRDWCKR